LVEQVEEEVTNHANYCDVVVFWEVSIEDILIHMANSSKKNSNKANQKFDIGIPIGLRVFVTRVQLMYDKLIQFPLNNIRIISIKQRFIPFLFGFSFLRRRKD
jgi:hypothetical protein